MEASQAATAQLGLYLRARAAFQEVKVCYTDEWGHELYPDLEKELQRQRQGVSGSLLDIQRSAKDRRSNRPRPGHLR